MALYHTCMRLSRYKIVLCIQDVIYTNVLVLVFQLNRAQLMISTPTTSRRMFYDQTDFGKAIGKRTEDYNLG